ncbi:hypothetical protein CF394_06825 [Tetzosporium hominis]|uniref:ATPase AAA-type core domain-containing protein n=1 Tax=Tetzosporium hominis TaxID=2020506 RepID=A0A264W4H0_9BACL|nr:ATP-binding protein [Tetzosporium hominis]OZS78464.1 hypothetical protein CF394_06825 [Tetzosporium hominis]
MIKSVKINNFKGLQNFALKDVGRINLLGGKNNAGKTSILEAIFLFYDRLNPNMIMRQYSWRGVGELALKPETVFAPIFKDYTLSNEITIEVLDQKSFTETMYINYKDEVNKVISVKSNDGQIRTDDNVSASHSLNIKIKSSNLKEQKIVLRLNNAGIELEAIEARPSDISANFLAAKAHPHPSENAVRFGELDIKGQSDVIIDFLKIIEPRLKSLSSITLSNNISMIYGDIGIGTKIPLSYMGDGISRLLTILLAIVSNKNGVVLIDEIENGIHYSILDKLWEVISTAAKEYNCQIFATTHSYECLSASIKGISDSECKHDFRYHRVERTKQASEIVSNTFNYEELESAIDSGWEVR